MSVGAGSGMAFTTIISSGSVALDWTQGNQPGVQQTVQSGPNSSGVPNFWVASGSSAVTLQNVSSGTPLVLNGWAAPDANGTHSLTCALTANSTTWSSLSSAVTYFLYATLSTSGGACTVTPGSTTALPVYQWGGTPSVTSGQITCNIAERKCYLGNGSTAPQTTLVVLGEVTGAAGTITNIVPYAYAGFYDSGWINTLPTTGSLTTKTSNLGTDYADVILTVKNITAESNFSVGDIVNITPLYFQSGLTRNSAFLTNGGVYFADKNTGVAFAPTSANWAYRVTAKRKW